MAAPCVLHVMILASHSTGRVRDVMPVSQNTKIYDPMHTSHHVALRANAPLSHFTIFRLGKMESPMTDDPSRKSMYYQAVKLRHFLTSLNCFQFQISQLLSLALYHSKLRRPKFMNIAVYQLLKLATLTSQEIPVVSLQLSLSLCQVYTLLHGSRQVCSDLIHFSHVSCFERIMKRFQNVPRHRFRFMTW